MIKREELVVGDLIDITEGMRVPADCILTKLNEVKVDRLNVSNSFSYITGQSQLF
jgi:magnesium-transporting ATPase (P-type)